jgi:hypothetical protein
MADSYFRRGGNRLECRQHHDRGGYTLTLGAPGCSPSVAQRFSDPISLARRKQALEQMLLAAGWRMDLTARRR